MAQRRMYRLGHYLLVGLVTYDFVYNKLRCQKEWRSLWHKMNPLGKEFDEGQRVIAETYRTFLKQMVRSKPNPRALSRHQKQLARRPPPKRNLYEDAEFNLMRAQLHCARSEWAKANRYAHDARVICGLEEFPFWAGLAGRLENQAKDHESVPSTVPNITGRLRCSGRRTMARADGANRERAQ